MCGDVRVDLAARVVRREGREIRLTPIENRLLSALVRNRGRLLAHDAVIREAWGAAHVEDRQTLRSHIANLRCKLAAPNSTGPIHTYPGVGYLLRHEVNPPSVARQPAGARTRLLGAA
jgi:two-component system KDP operon response regulator KdpE